MLAAHNAVRAQVHVPPLVWSEPLEARARSWANRLLREGKFMHTPKGAYGENLYEVEGTYAVTASPREVVKAWADEAAFYDHRSNTCRDVCGHYTQIVWSDTRAVGCAAARNSRREVWVCNYDPPGNWVGRRPY
jgi:uncharacterized protein YkwD